MQTLSTNRANADMDIRWDPWFGANPDTDRIEFTLHDALKVQIDLGEPVFPATEHAGMPPNPAGNGRDIDPASEEAMDRLQTAAQDMFAAARALGAAAAHPATR